MAEIAKWEILSYSRKQQQNEIVGQWQKIVATNADKNGFVRSVKLRLIYQVRLIWPFDILSDQLIS